MPTSLVGAIQRPSLYTLSPTFQPRTYAGGGLKWVSGLRPDYVQICSFVNGCEADAFWRTMCAMWAHCTPQDAAGDQLSSNVNLQSNRCEPQSTHVLHDLGFLSVHRLFERHIPVPQNRVNVHPAMEEQHHASTGLGSICMQWSHRRRACDRHVAGLLYLQDMRQRFPRQCSYRTRPESRAR